MKKTYIKPDSAVIDFASPELLNSMSGGNTGLNLYSFDDYEDDDDYDGDGFAFSN